MSAPGDGFLGGRHQPEQHVTQRVWTTDLSGAGKDDLFGEGGSDNLSGAGGNDRLFGGPGAIDMIRGGTGTDAASSDSEDTYESIETLLA